MEKPLPPDVASNLREYGVGAEETIFAANLAIGGFAASYHHCEQLADYVSQFVTSNRPESDRLNSMLSMGLNELFEMAYRHHGSSGVLHLEVRHGSGADGLTGPLFVIARIPVDDSALAAYEWCRERLTGDDARGGYRELAQSGFEGVERKTGLLELAAVWNIDLTIHAEPNDDRVVITMTVLDGAKQ